MCSTEDCIFRVPAVSHHNFVLFFQQHVYDHAYLLRIKGVACKSSWGSIYSVKNVFIAKQIETNCHPFP